MLGVKADKVLLESEENNIIVDNIIIGIYNGNLSRDGKYRALVGLELLDVIENVGESNARPNVTNW